MTKDSSETTNSIIFKRLLSHFIEIEKKGEYQQPDLKTGAQKVLGVKAKITREKVSFEEVRSVSPPPFSELSKRLDAYEYYNRILHGGPKSSGEGRRQSHCLDWLPVSQFSVERLLWDCAEAIRFEQKYDDHVRQIEWVHGHQMREACISPQKATERALDMRRLAVTVNPSLATGTAMLQRIDDPKQAVYAANKAKHAAIARKFGCALFSENIQLRQIKQKTPALLAFNLRWLFQNWPLTPNTGRQNRGMPPAKMSPPCYDLIADFVNAIFSAGGDEQHDAITVKDNLLKSIPSDAQYCGW